jgi:membrane-associated phospholipid phosphatase
LVHVSKALIGNGFPSGHVFGAVVFYGLLTGVALRRVRWMPVRLLAPALGISIVAMAAVARVYLGEHWPSDVLGGLLLGSVTLAGLLWVYAGLSAGCIEFLGLESRVTSLGKRASGPSFGAAPAMR